MRVSRDDIDRFKSEPFNAYSGVPQGSKFDSVFFNIFIDTLCYKFKYFKNFLYAEALKHISFFKNIYQYILLLVC